MNKLPLYLFREVLTAFVFSTVAVSFVVLFTQSFKFLSFVIDNSATTLVFVQLMGLLLPTFLPFILPLSLGISVLFVYHKLAVDSEIVVMRAAGVSPLKLAVPALILASGVMLVCFALTTWLTPAANRQLVTLQYRVRDNFSLFLLRPGAFNDLSDGLTFFVRKRGGNGELRDILVHDVRRPETPVTIMAQAGQFALVDGQPQVTVFKGKRQEFDTRTGRLSQLGFDRYVLDISFVKSATSTRLPDPREQTMAELLSPPADPAARRRPLGHMQAEFHQRLAFPLLCLSYAMIGLTAILAGEFNRRGMVRRILLAALAIIAVQAGSLSLGSLSNRREWLIPVLYAFAIAAVPACCVVLRTSTLWPRFLHWKARTTSGAREVTP